MASLHFPHRQKTCNKIRNSKITKLFLTAIVLVSLFSQRAFAHDFDISNPDLLKIELSDTILVRPPPMTNPIGNASQNTLSNQESTTPAQSNPEIDIINLLGLLLTFTGFIIGLGAVTVIDLHGFLARKSIYWTQATIRTHKITKPLIWIGMFLVILGEAHIYRHVVVTQTLIIQITIAFILLLNGCFLTFKISPYLLKLEKQNQGNTLLPKTLQQKIFVSFLISFFGWWTEVVLLCLYLGEKLM